MGASKLLQVVKERFPSNYWTQEIIQDFLRNQTPAQLYTVKKSISIPITAPYAGFNYQGDLMDVSRWSRNNSGIHFLLCVVDIYSRYAWVVAVKSKSASEVAAGIASIFKEASPVKIGTDNGKEFLNSSVRKVMEEYKVIHFTNEPGDHNKMGIVEAFNKTIRGLIAKYMIGADSYTYVGVLDKLVENYNNNIHSTIKCKPIDAWSGKAIPAAREAVGNLNAYVVGATVRVAEPRTKFSKSSDQRWGDELHTIRDIEGNRFLLSDRRKKFSANELLLVTNAEQKKEKTVTAEASKNIVQQRTIERKLAAEDIKATNVKEQPRVRKPVNYSLLHTQGRKQ